MLLAVDIGNTNISLGVFEQTSLLAFWRVATDRRRMADEYRVVVSSLLSSGGWRMADVERAVVASVVPPVRSELERALVSAGIGVTVLTGESEFGISVRYRPPASVGADRLANAIAATDRYGMPVVIVDIGTATTLDVVDDTGSYIGGAIAPGIEASLDSLVRAAFHLPRLELSAPERAIGQTTVESIRSGTLLGYADLVDGLIDRFRRELNGDPAIVGTGGLASLVAPLTRQVKVVHVELTLEGLRLAYGRLAGEPSR